MSVLSLTNLSRHLESPLCLAFAWEPTPMEQPLFEAGNPRVQKMTRAPLTAQISLTPAPLSHTHYPTCQHLLFVFVFFFSFSIKYNNIWSLLSIFTANIQVNNILFSNYFNIFITKSLLASKLHPNSLFSTQKPERFFLKC